MGVSVLHSVFSVKGVTAVAQKYVCQVVGGSASFCVVFGFRVGTLPRVVRVLPVET